MATASPRRLLRRPSVRPLGGLTSLDDKAVEVERDWFRQEVCTVRDFIRSRSHRFGTAKSRLLTHPLSRDRAMSAVSRKLCWAGQTSGRVNNAYIAQFYNPVPDRVVNAEIRDSDILGHVLPVCARHGGRWARSCSDIRAMQCEVLGPFFCSDCIRIRKEEQVEHENSSLYPDIHVHPRCLVAPVKVEKFNAALPSACFPTHRKFECGCELSLSPDLSSPVVFTENDVHGRMCRAYRNVLRVESDRPLVKWSPPPSRRSSLTLSLSPAWNRTPDHADVAEEAEEEEEGPRTEGLKVTVRFHSTTSQRGVSLW